MFCECGNDRFFAHQVQYYDVIVHGDNYWTEDVECYEANDPYGPYTCTKCGKVYAELEDCE